MPSKTPTEPSTPPPTRHERINEETGAGVATDLVHPQNEGFREKITPKSIDGNLFVYSCACTGSHFRHAGYMKILLPFMKPGMQKSMAVETRQVMVCVKCRKCYIWDGEQMYDVTEKVDLEAWEKAEKELHKATGPGGEC